MPHTHEHTHTHTQTHTHKYIQAHTMHTHTHIHTIKITLTMCIMHTHTHKHNACAHTHTHTLTNTLIKGTTSCTTTSIQRIQGQKGGELSMDENKAKRQYYWLADEKLVSTGLQADLYGGTGELHQCAAELHLVLEAGQQLLLVAVQLLTVHAKLWPQNLSCKGQFRWIVVANAFQVTEQTKYDQHNGLPPTHTHTHLPLFKPMTNSTCCLCLDKKRLHILPSSSCLIVNVFHNLPNVYFPEKKRKTKIACWIWPEATILPNVKVLALSSAWLLKSGQSGTKSHASNCLRNALFPLR